MPGCCCWFLLLLSIISWSIHKFQPYLRCTIFSTLLHDHSRTMKFALNSKKKNINNNHGREKRNIERKKSLANCRQLKFHKYLIKPIWCNWWMLFICIMDCFFVSLLSFLCVANRKVEKRWTSILVFVLRRTVVERCNSRKLLIQWNRDKTIRNIRIRFDVFPSFTIYSQLNMINFFMEKKKRKILRNTE